MGISQKRTETGAALPQRRSSRLLKTCQPLPTTQSLQAFQHRSATRCSSVLMHASKIYIFFPAENLDATVKINECVNSPLGPFQTSTLMLANTERFISSILGALNSSKKMSLFFYLSETSSHTAFSKLYGCNLLEGSV